MQISTAGGRGGGRRSGVITQEILTGGCVCVCLCASKRDTDRQTDWEGLKKWGEQDEAGDTLYSLPFGDADGKGEDGEQAEGRDGGMHGRREVCVHLAGGDEELLQIQPALSAAALWVFLARTRVPCVTEFYLWCVVCQRLMMSRRRQKTRCRVRMCPYGDVHFSLWCILYLQRFFKQSFWKAKSWYWWRWMADNFLI